MFHPTIDLLFQISTTSHPRFGARNPQEKGSSNSPLIALNPQPNGILLQLSQISSNSLSLDPPNPRNVPLHCSQFLGHPIFFIRVSLAQVTRNLSAGNARELPARKTIGKNNNNTFCFSETHLRVHFSGLTTLQFLAPICSKKNPTCSIILPTFIVQFQ
jgi:hypothetical protein